MNVEAESLAIKRGIAVLVQYSTSLLQQVEDMSYDEKERVVETLVAGWEKMREGRMAPEGWLKHLKHVESLRTRQLTADVELNGKIYQFIFLNPQLILSYALRQVTGYDAAIAVSVSYAPIPKSRVNDYVKFNQTVIDVAPSTFYFGTGLEASIDEPFFFQYIPCILIGGVKCREELRARMETVIAWLNENEPLLHNFYMQREKIWKLKGRERRGVKGSIILR